MRRSGRSNDDPRAFAIQQRAHDHAVRAADLNLATRPRIADWHTYPRDQGEAGLKDDQFGHDGFWYLSTNFHVLTGGRPRPGTDPLAIAAGLISPTPTGRFVENLCGLVLRLADLFAQRLIDSAQLGSAAQDTFFQLQVELA